MKINFLYFALLVYRNVIKNFDICKLFVFQNHYKNYFEELFAVLSECYFSVKLQIKSAKKLHESMMSSVMRSTMQFFESTPIGRILNRFSKDLNSVEFPLPISLKDFLFCLLDAINILVMISISTPWVLVVLLILLIGYFKIQVFFQVLRYL